ITGECEGEGSGGSLGFLLSARGVPPIIYFGVTTCHQRGRAAGEPPISASRSTRASSPRSIPHSRLLRVIVLRTSVPLSTACRPYNRLRLRRRSREPSPVSELAPWERVLSE